MIERINNFRGNLQNTFRQVNKIDSILYSIRAQALQQSVLDSTAPGVTSERIADTDVIVSLTTHGKRIWEVYLAIESIMRQSQLPNRIVLWLDERLEGSALPATLRRQVQRGLEIRYCKDIRSYTKLIPQLRLSPEASIITIDDDILYNFDLVDRLVMAHNAEPKMIHAARAHKITLGSDNRPLPYSEWEWETKDMETSPLIFPTGVGGVIYPPRAFDEDIFDESVFMSKCKYADDIWFKAMALKKGTPTRRIQTSDINGNDHLENGTVQDVRLSEINVEGGNNDSQLRAVFDHYDLYPLLQGH